MTPISERAVKHAIELKRIKQENPEMRCILLFVVMRHDSHSLEISRLDPTYQAVIQRVYEHGVEIRAIQLRFTEDGNIYLNNLNFPIMI